VSDYRLIVDLASKTLFLRASLKLPLDKKLEKLDYLIKLQRVS
jgi:hypothetical protein